MNRALAKNCAAPLDEKNRVQAKKWKDGKPVRVVCQMYFLLCKCSYIMW